MGKMNAIRILNVSFHLTIFLLFLMSLMAITIAYIWIFNPLVIRNLDAFVISRYTSKTKSQLHQANTLIAKGKDEDALRILKSITEELKDIKKQDRLAPIKQKTINKIVQVYTKRKEFKDALKWLDIWLAFNDRDLVAQVKRAKLLTKIPGREMDGEKIISELYDKVPMFHDVVFSHIDILIKNRKYTEAYLAAYNYSTSLDLQIADMNWEVYWDTGKNFNRSQKKKVNPTRDNFGYLNFSTIIPRGSLKHFRIDYPSNVKLLISNATISFDDSVQKSSLLLENLVVRWNNIISSDKGIFLTDGQYPYLYFEVPEGMGINGEVKIIFRAKISAAIPKKLSNLLSDSKIRDNILNDLFAIGDYEAADYINYLNSN